MPPKIMFDGTKWDCQFYTIKDALKDRPPTAYLINPILPEASLSMFYGLPGTHKTNLVIDAVVCSTLGINWLSSDCVDGFKTKKVPVMWIDADSGEDILHERFAASVRTHAKSALHQSSIELHYSSFLDPPFVITEDAPVNEIIRRAIEWKVKIIVFDNLLSIAGGIDENSPLMGVVMNRLRQIAMRTRAAVIVIHHTAKKMGEKDRKSPRGHGSIEAALDSAFWVTVKGAVITARQTKCRRSPVEPFSGLFDYSHKLNTEDLLTMNFVGQEAELPEEYVKARQTVLEYMRVNKSGNQSQLVGSIMKCKIGRDKAITIVQVFLKCNLLKVKAGQHNSKILELGNPKAKIKSIP